MAVVRSFTVTSIDYNFMHIRHAPMPTLPRFLHHKRNFPLQQQICKRVPKKRHKSARSSFAPKSRNPDSATIHNPIAAKQYFAKCKLSPALLHCCTAVAADAAAADAVTLPAVRHWCCYCSCTMLSFICCPLPYCILFPPMQFCQFNVNLVWTHLFSFFHLRGRGCVVSLVMVVA